MRTNAQLQVVDEKILNFQECIRQLKSQRNCLVPISQLPPEILGTIFYFASAGRTRTSSAFPCYYFTHVSRSWRSVALNTPNLWNVLPSSIPWATAMLERSKGVDLVVGSHLSYRPHSHPRVLFMKGVLTNHASRIRELDLSGIGPSTLATLFENVPQSSLRLHSFGFRGRAFPISTVETGNLRTLAVVGCDGPWCSLPLPALTNLKLHQLPTPPPLVQFLEMLRRLPSLEVLDLKDSLPLSKNPVGLIGPIKLPRLNYLHLSSSRDCREVTNILSVILVPPSATLKFRGEKRSMTSQQINIMLDELSSSFSTFFSRLGRESDLSYRNLRVFSRVSGDLHLQAWKDNGRVSATPDFDLMFRLRPSNLAQDVLQSVFTSLPFFDITTLTLDIVPRAMFMSLKNNFGQLAHLQNVTVVGNCTDEFIQALTFKPENYNTEHSAYCCVSFPALQFLWIQNCLFERCTVDYLQDCLIERCERRAELLELKFTGCDGLSSRNLASLRGIVNDVKWDRFGLWNSDLEESGSTDLEG